MTTLLPDFLGTHPAACAQPGIDPDTFHTATPTARTTAKAVCARCPLTTACLTYALDNPTLRGVWGGTTSRERNRLRGQPDTTDPDIDPDGRPRPVCASPSALRAHRRAGETCAECEDAHAVRLEAQRREQLAREHAKGGTATGYMVHRRLGEKACALCLGGLRRHGAAQRERAGRAAGAVLAVAS